MHALPSLIADQLPTDLANRTVKHLLIIPVTIEGECEYIKFDQERTREWIEAQLLDCMNLARQHGLIRVAAILDGVLDVLAEEDGSDARHG